MCFYSLSGCLGSQKHVAREHKRTYQAWVPLNSDNVLILKISWPSFPLPDWCSPVSRHQPSYSFFHANDLFLFFFCCCCINPADQVGFVNVLKFNTLGHLSLWPNPGAVSHQTAYFLIWFGSKVAQESAEGGGRGWWWWWWSRVGLGGRWGARGGGAGYLMKSWCEVGEEDPVKAYQGWSGRSRRRAIHRKQRPSGEVASLGQLCFSCFAEPGRSAPMWPLHQGPARRPSGQG